MNIRFFISLWLLALSLVSANLYADDLTDLLSGKPAQVAADSTKVIATDSTVQSDKKIRQRLKDIFAELDSLKSLDIQVNKGVVTLSGEVDSSASQTRALQFAHQIDGVVEVENNLTINRSLTKRLQNTWDKLLNMGKQTLAGLPVFLLAMLVLLLFWMLGRWISHRQGAFRRISPNYFIANLLGQIVHLVFIMIGLVLSLSLLDATALLGTILGAAGIVGLAVGFAVRDTVENYIASILLSIRNPFEVNDLIQIEGYEGTVASLNSRATILISPDGNHIRIPNAIVFKAVITNFTRNPERRFQFDVGVDTEQNLLAAQALALETLQAMSGIMTSHKPVVLIEALGDSNVLLRMYAWVDQRQYNFGKVRSEAIRSVKQAFDQAGIVMPEPIYNLRVNQPMDNPPPFSSGVASVENQQAVQDVDIDRTIEDKVLQDQSYSSSENLLTPQAEKE